MRLGTLVAAALLAAASGLTAPRSAAAQELPQTRVRVVGYFSNLLQVREVERPFWMERIPQASGGRITAEYANQDTVGVRDFQILRVLQQGVTDFAASDISKMAGDDPVFEGCDLAGMVDDIQTARRACEAWRPAMAEAMERKFNARLMALFPNPSIVYWCNTPITSLEDLRGKRVRVFNITQGDFVRAVGAAAVTIPFPEVVPAMQRRVVDCGLTGTLSGNAAGWPEVTTHLFTLNAGWSIAFQAVNRDAWNRYPPAVQQFFTTQFGTMENDLWTLMDRATDQGIACNIGRPDCTMGRPGNMTLVPVPASDTARRTQILNETVLTAWGRRCGRPCAERWNATVGPIVNLRIPLDRL
jgi:TRAP-type C4-dicarboxylate transport system substrate-binding protein